MWVRRGLVEVAWTLTEVLFACPALTATHYNERMSIKLPPPGEVTPESLYLNRREWLKNAGLFTATSAGLGGGLVWLTSGGAPKAVRAAAPAMVQAGAGPELKVSQK